MDTWEQESCWSWYSASYIFTTCKGLFNSMWRSAQCANRTSTTHSALQGYCNPWRIHDVHLTMLLWTLLLGYRAVRVDTTLSFRLSTDSCICADSSHVHLHYRPSRRPTYSLSIGYAALAFPQRLFQIEMWNLHLNFGSNCSNFLAAR